MAKILVAPDIGLAPELLLRGIISCRIWLRYFRPKLVPLSQQLEIHHGQQDSLAVLRSVGGVSSDKHANHFCGKLLGLCLRKLAQCLLYAPLYQLFSCPLITSSFKCIIFSDIVCCLLSEWLVTTSFYQRPQAMSFFIYATYYICNCSIITRLGRWVRI